MRHTPTPEQKWQYKKIKKSGEFTVNAQCGNYSFHTPTGTIRITRTKTYNTYTPQCEVDIVFTGTINQYGRTMGPVREMNARVGYGRAWRSTIQRNGVVRRSLKGHILNYLKYFGIDIPYEYNIHIKKIVWDK